MKQKRKQIIAENEVSEIRNFVLGGYSQKIAIDGKKKSNPVVIFLHGGPGSPIPFSVGCRGMFPQITESVTMVYWDQLGCGINNYPIDNTFSISDFVEMTHDLIKEIKRLFPENEIILFGVSWGSILALKAVTEYNAPVNRVVTYGQILCDLTFNEEVYGALEASSMPVKKKYELARIRSCKDHSIDEAGRMMRWIQKYTEGYQCKSGEKMPMGNIIRGLITSPDYRMKDFKALVINGYKKNNSLMKELFDIDLRECFEKVAIPYLVLQGSTDIVASTSKIMEFIAKSKNKYVTCKVIENCGHIPDSKGMNEIMKACIEK